ncbi:hypothetical protein RUM43_005149 [Polyplax serrata]|uniref:LRRCT domain-containing protein n=1 Tax=Polyplax serrata TaxID=468196 RepID=A0AAN8SD18_POLSC
MIRTIPLGLLLVLCLIGTVSGSSRWKCPELNDTTASCICEFPQALRCSINLNLLKGLVACLKDLPTDEVISLLDLTIPNITHLPGHQLEGVSLHGLVLTSGDLRNLSTDAFFGLSTPLQALGLPNNKLDRMPVEALKTLTKLEQLDLSFNNLSSLNSTSLTYLTVLTFLDLSNNQIENLKPNTFSHMKSLSTMKLNNNRLKVADISALVGLENLRELYLNGNKLLGILNSTTFPIMPSLQTLSLANNQFRSIAQGAMKGATGLQNLILSHNQIDVLEDHSFKEVKKLRSLSLSSNRIVAISGLSLAHLTELTELDLSHNFLRALTPDIVVPLTNLRILCLDDNDISMVESGTFRNNTTLERFTLSDNPLSCDCNLVNFSVWLSNATKISPGDKSTAVCMTPIHLENALLIEVPPTELRCDEDDYFLLMQEGPSAAHISGSQIVLRAFHFNGTGISLLWSIDTDARSFACDAVFVYEETSLHEILLASTPLKCNSSDMSDPTTLVVKLGLGSMQPFHRYRYCLVLIEDDKFTDEVQLVLGCSEIIPLTTSNNSISQPPRSNASTRITSLRAKASADSLTIVVDLWNQKKLNDTCHVTVVVFSTNVLLAQHLLNCTNPNITLHGLADSTHQVCATLDRFASRERLQCITVNGQMKSLTNVWLTICYVIFISFAFLLLFCAYRKLVNRYGLKVAHQHFLQYRDLEEQKPKQYSRYVKLHTADNL